MFLISINLDKEFFIRTTATMYFFASIPLYSSMVYHGLGNYYDLIMSLILVIPAILGQFFGSKVRKKFVFGYFTIQNTVFYLFVEENQRKTRKFWQK